MIGNLPKTIIKILSFLGFLAWGCHKSPLIAQPSYSLGTSRGRFLSNSCNPGIRVGFPWIPCLRRERNPRAPQSIQTIFTLAQVRKREAPGYILEGFHTELGGKHVFKNELQRLQLARDSWSSAVWSESREWAFIYPKDPCRYVVWYIPGPESRSHIPIFWVYVCTVLILGPFGIEVAPVGRNLLLIGLYAFGPRLGGHGSMTP